MVKGHRSAQEWQEMAREDVGKHNAPWLGSGSHLPDHQGSVSQAATAETMAARLQVPASPPV